MLSKVLKIYFGSYRINYFSGAHNFYDLWVFDELPDPTEGGSLYESNGEGTAYSNTLLKMLDGQECQLDTKYGRLFRKTVNVPTVLIASKLYPSLKQTGPFHERFMRLKFRHRIENLEPERLAATLLGCVRRRFF